MISNATSSVVASAVIFTIVMSFTRQATLARLMKGLDAMVTNQTKTVRNIESDRTMHHNALVTS